MGFTSPKGDEWKYLPYATETPALHQLLRIIGVKTLEEAVASPVVMGFLKYIEEQTPTNQSLVNYRKALVFSIFRQTKMSDTVPEGYELTAGSISNHKAKIWVALISYIEVSRNTTEEANYDRVATRLPKPRVFEES